MLRLALLRSARALATLAICVTIVFVVLRSAGDPIATLLPPDTPPDVVDAYRVRLGLDRPIVAQYVGYLRALAAGDFGRSFAEHRSAFDMVAERLPATLRLSGLALLLALLGGVALGIAAAVKHDTVLDRLAMTLAVSGYSLPSFFLAILLIMLFSLQLRLLPSAGSDTALHMIMPVATLAAPAAAKLARFTRAAMLDVLGRPYIRTATSKGVGQLALLLRHALPNAAIPIVTILGFELGNVLGVGVVVEAVFAWPGIGRLLVISVGQRDLPVVQTIVLFIATAMVGAHLVADLAYGWLDPRLRLVVRR